MGRGQRKPKTMNDRRWRIVMSRSAQKSVKKMPKTLLRRIDTWITDIHSGTSPLSGDVKKLNHQASSYRKRIGNYRIFFEIMYSEVVVYIIDVKRRTK